MFFPKYFSQVGLEIIFSFFADEIICDKLFFAPEYFERVPFANYFSVNTEPDPCVYKLKPGFGHLSLILGQSWKFRENFERILSGKYF